MWKIQELLLREKIYYRLESHGPYRKNGKDTSKNKLMSVKEQIYID